MNTSLKASQTKCSKKDPSACQLHGAAYREKENFIQEIRQELLNEKHETEEEKTLRTRITEDLEANLKLKTVKGSTTISVYRSGIPKPPTERKVEGFTYTIADEYMPEGRQGRTSAVFASPTIGGVTRWVRGNSWMKNIIPDIQVRELRINIDETYIYEVNAWERASNKMFDDWTYEQNKASSEDRVKHYWDTGMTVREWLEKVKTNPSKYNPENWEILIPYDENLEPKQVSPTKVAKYTYDNYSAGETLKELKINQKEIRSA